MSLAHTIEDFLEQHGARYTTEVHATTQTSHDTATCAHIDEAMLAKSVVLEDDRGFVLAVIPASRRLELRRVRDELGRSLHLSREHDMVRLFPDCALGAIPPLGAAYGLVTVVDASLEQSDEIYFEGGDHMTLVCMEGDEFLDLLENAMVADIASDSVSLSSALAKRERLYSSLVAVDQALTAPSGVGTPWRRRLTRELNCLMIALEEHIAETEGPDGLLAEVEGQAPRLAHEADRLRSEHARLRESCHQTLERIVEDESADSVRKQVLRLLGWFGQHRHRSADLVYDAFGVDIGGG